MITNRRSRRTMNQVEQVPFTIQRRNNANIGEGIQAVELVGCEYTYGRDKTELVKLTFKHLDTGVTDTFNFINGSRELDEIMDVLDPTGMIQIDFREYLGAQMKVEIKAVDRYRNIVSASSIDEDEQEEADEAEDDPEEEDEFDTGLDLELELDDDDIMLEDDE